MHPFTTRHLVLCALLALRGVASAAPALAQGGQDPFADSLRADNAIRVGFTEFATLPDIDGVPARMMLMLDEPGTRRLFVNDQRGPIYAISYDGRSVALYVDAGDPRWSVGVQSRGRERGMQSFAFHPQFAEAGTPGHGRFYTWTDVVDTTPPADFLPSGGSNTHDLVLHEWTARDPRSAVYDGGPPREVMRFQQPYANHNGGRIAFNPLARPGDAEFGLLYIGNGDGGSGGDPHNHGQDLSSGFGKVLRIDPLGTNATNRRYGIPAGNPFASDAAPNTLGEIFAYGVRNPQHLAWDSRTGRMFLTDIGQGTIEELDTLSAGSNLGWNVWEGSYRYSGRQGVSSDAPRSDPRMTYPIAEFGHSDPLLQGRSAASGLVVHRGTDIPQLANLVLWADLTSGEIFAVSADELPGGGQRAMRRVLLNDGGAAKPLLSIIQAKNASQGREQASRADLRFGFGPGDQLFLLNKADGVIRLVTR